MDLKELDEKAKEIRRKILDVGVKCGQAHLGGALSSVELLLALYNGGVLKKEDHFVFSKGHCPLAFYTILADNDVISEETLNQYGSLVMPGHSDWSTPGVEMTAGSLGYGLGFGCGIALAAKLDKKDYKTYVLLGDTECTEGSIWEAVMFASSNELNNLIVIVDDNKFGVLGHTNKYASKSPMFYKWLGFNWNIYEIDGHNLGEIISCFKEIKETKTNKPAVIISHTIKGKGISFMEGVAKWHHGIPKGAELKQAIEELKEKKYFIGIDFAKGEELKEKIKIPIEVMA